jgi:pyruvate dehydrogenase E1 component beta subunit
MTATEVQTMTFAEATRQALSDAMEDDPTVFCLGEDIGDRQGGGTFKATAGLSTRFGEARVRTTPISEQAIIGAAIGAANVGMRPVAEIMLMNFISVCMDQLVNHAAKMRFMSGGQATVPMTVRTATGAGGGFGAQHSDMLEAWLAHTPGLKVVVPSTPADAYGLLTSCIFDDDPCVVIENTLLYFQGATGEAPARGHRVPLGQANVVRAGSDLTVVTYGRPLGDVLALADDLAHEGTNLEVKICAASPHGTKPPCSTLLLAPAEPWSSTRRCSGSESEQKCPAVSPKNCSLISRDRSGASALSTAPFRSRPRWNRRICPDRTGCDPPCLPHSPRRGHGSKKPPHP